eukprot:scaffold54828_cov30-Tisochrysis_lutea.AAC.20
MSRVPLTRLYVQMRVRAAEYLHVIAVISLSRVRHASLSTPSPRVNTIGSPLCPTLRFEPPKRSRLPLTTDGVKTIDAEVAAALQRKAGEASNKSEERGCEQQAVAQSLVTTAHLHPAFGKLAIRRNNIDGKHHPPAHIAIDADKPVGHRLCISPIDGSRDAVQTLCR